MTARQDPVLAALDQAASRCGDDPTRRAAIAKVRADHIRDHELAQQAREQRQRISRNMRHQQTPGPVAVLLVMALVLAGLLALLVAVAR